MPTIEYNLGSINILNLHDKEMVVCIVLDICKRTNGLNQRLIITQYPQLIRRHDREAIVIVYFEPKCKCRYHVWSDIRK